MLFCRQLPKKLRFSTNPSKQLLWLWLARDMRELGGERGLDAACGLMENRRFFRTDQYLGFDADAQRLTVARQLNPDAEAIHLQIDDLTDEYTSDVVLCVQTLGANKFFDHSATLEAVRKLIEVTKPGGSLILNVGGKASHAGIVELLREAFGSVEVRRYGDFNQHLPGPAALLVALAFYLFPSMRGDKKLYCLCRDRRS